MTTTESLDFRERAASRWLIATGLFFYLVSLWLPVIEDRRILLGHDAMSFSYRYGTSGFLGLVVEAALAEGDNDGREVSVAYMRWIGWAWLANLAVAAGVIGLFVQSRDLLRALTILSFMCVLLALGGVFIPLFDGRVPARLPNYGLGYLAWISALSLISAGLLLAPKSTRGQESAAS